MQRRDRGLLIHAIQMTLGGVSHLSVEDDDFLRMPGACLSGLGGCGAGASLTGTEAFREAVASGAE